MLGCLHVWPGARPGTTAVASGGRRLCTSSAPPMRPRRVRAACGSGVLGADWTWTVQATVSTRPTQRSVRTAICKRPLCLPAAGDPACASGVPTHQSGTSNDAFIARHDKGEW